jgi:hypothetical protein
MCWKWSALAVLAAVIVYPADADTIVTCDGISNPLSCSATDSLGGFVRGSASEKYSLTNGIFNYQSNAQLAVLSSHRNSGPAGANHTGSIEIASSFELNSSGPVRSGYLNLFGNSSQISANSLDSSVNASASYQLIVGGAYELTCANGYGCFLPVRYIPITLGESLDIQLVGEGDGNSYSDLALASLFSNLQFEFLEADRFTQVSITSFHVVTPEPATWMLALPCILLIILANLRLAHRRKQDQRDTDKDIGAGAARRRNLLQRRGNRNEAE